jgi:hypothetical protein
MKKNWIYLLLIGGAFAYFYGKKKLQQSIQFTLESVKLSGTKLIVRLGMLNPTGSSATINSIVGSIYIKGSAVATVENYTKIKILPKSKSFIDLTVTPSGAGVFSFVKSLIDLFGLSSSYSYSVSSACCDSGCVFGSDFGSDLTCLGCLPNFFKFFY